MANIKTNSDDLNTNIKLEQHHNYTIEDILDGYVRSPQGAVFTVNKSNDISRVMLKSSTGSVSVPCIHLLLLLNRGEWVFSKELTVEMQYPELTKEQVAHKHNILKALLFGQMALEANELLAGTLDHDKYLSNVLRKSNKELERRSNKNITAVYGANPEMLTNLFSAMDRFVGRMVDKLPHEVFFLDLVMDSYEADPEGWQQQPVELTKLDS